MAKETRTYADRRDYLIKAVTERRRKIKERAIAFMGGKCQICGYKKYQGALDFHHIDPATKSFGIGGYGHARSWERVKIGAGKVYSSLRKLSPGNRRRDHRGAANAIY